MFDHIISVIIYILHTHWLSQYVCVCMHMCVRFQYCLHALYICYGRVHCCIVQFPCVKGMHQYNYSLAVYEHVESGPRINYGAEVNFICNVNRIKCNESGKPV